MLPRPLRPQEAWDAQEMAAFEESAGAAAAPASLVPEDKESELMMRITDMTVRELRKELDSRGMSVQVTAAAWRCRVEVQEPFLT